MLHNHSIRHVSCIQNPHLLTPQLPHWSFFRLKTAHHTNPMSSITYITFSLQLARGYDNPQFRTSYTSVRPKGPTVDRLVGFGRNILAKTRAAQAFRCRFWLLTIIYISSRRVMQKDVTCSRNVCTFWNRIHSSTNFWTFLKFEHVVLHYPPDCNLQFSDSD